MGLSPQYYDGCTDDVLKLYAELEDRIIEDIVRRIIKTGNITETAKWQLRQTQQMGLLYDNIVEDIAISINKTDSEVRRMFERAGVETINNDNRLHIQAGKSPLDIRQSESMLQILNGVYKNSLTDLKNLTGTTAITSQTSYINACNSAFMMVSSGAFSYQQALRTVIQEVGQNGATVSYPSGHVDKLDVAVRRSLLTGIGLASRQISEENSKLCDCDLMELSAHSGARPSHAEWQGQLVSLSGRKGYLTKDDIGYGTGAGFGGYNCQHDWYPFYEGISKRNYTKADIDKLNAKDIEYNNKMYSEYEISQMLRKKEREIRALKREKIAYKTAVEEGQTFLKSDLTALNGKIKDKSNQIQEFCNQTGYNRDRFRESINPKTSVRHTSGNARKYKDTLKNRLTFTQDSGNIKSIEYLKIDNTENLQKILGKSEKDFLFKVTEQDRDIIDYYTASGAFYINSALRGINGYALSDDGVKQEIEHLKNVITKYQLDVNVVTYRAIPDDIVKELKIGSTYVDKGFQSTSPLKSAVVEYATDNDYNSMFEIEVKATKNIGAYINSLSNYGKDIEYEFLLNEGLTFKVIDIYQDKNDNKIIKVIII